MRDVQNAQKKKIIFVEIANRFFIIFMLSYRHNKRKEANTMKNNNIYVNTTTGEATLSHNEAMEMYRAGHDIAVYSWSNACEELIERITWVH